MVGENASSTERSPHGRSGNSTSIAILGEYCGLVFIKECGEFEPRGRWTGDEDCARADQFLPFEGTVKGAIGRAMVAMQGI